MTQVLFVPCWGPHVPRNLPTLRRKRSAIWENARRNDLVVHLATSLSMEPKKTLRGLGVQAREIGLPERYRQRVTILVEGVGHASKLTTLLPRWVCQDAIPYEDEPEAEDEFADPPPGRIATLMFAAKYSIGADIILRATGGTGRLGGECVLGVGRKPRSSPKLIVDLFDEDGGPGRRDSEIRRDEYRQSGVREIRPNA